jgi:UPF0148 protein
MKQSPHTKWHQSDTQIIHDSLKPFRKDVTEVTTNQKDLQNMADLLKQGATLTELSCPACASPIFKLRSGELWCVKCQKRVITIKEGETSEETDKSIMLSGLESTVLSKIREVQAKINEEKDTAQLEKLSATLASLLDNLEKIKKMKQ